MSVDLSDLSSAINSDSKDREDSPQEENIFESWTLSSRTIAKYRLNYLFRQPCSVFFKSVLGRIPSGRKVYLILLMLGLEKLAYSAASDYFLFPFLSKVGVGVQYLNLIRAIVTYIVAFLLFPIAGWIADAYVGQYRMIHFSLWLLWFGYVAMAILYSISDFPAVRHYNYYPLPFLFVIVSLGSAGFQASAIPFGANLIMYKTSQELSSYFYCYYWVRNFGLTISLVSSTCSNMKDSMQAVVFVMISVSCITLALSLNGCFKSWFKLDKERVNPYKKVFQVLYLALVIKRPIHRSAFSFTGALPPSRLDLTKTLHGGKFTNEEVEDVKTFLRLLLMLVFLLSSLVIYTGVTQVLPIQLHDMNAITLKRHIEDCELSDKFPLAANVILVITLIPLLNSVVYPFLREYMPNMVKRIGIGAIMAVVAQLSILLISTVGIKREWANTTPKQQCMLATNFSDTAFLEESYDYSQVTEWLVIIPLFFITLAEILINITSLEFLYAQSPHKMRGMMIGLLFFLWGVATAMAQILITTFGYSSGSRMTCDFWYYLLHMFVAVIGFVGYTLLAYWYKNRQRGERDTQIFYRRQ